MSRLAQLGERATVNREVDGSKPSSRVWCCVCSFVRIEFRLLRPFSPARLSPALSPSAWGKGLGHGFILICLVFWDRTVQIRCAAYRNFSYAWLICVMCLCVYLKEHGERAHIVPSELVRLICVCVCLCVCGEGEARKEHTLHARANSCV